MKKIKEPQKHNFPNSLKKLFFKIFVILMLFITTLILEITPTYSTEGNLQNNNEIEDHSKTINITDPILNLPRLDANWRLFSVQKQILDLSEKEIGTCGSTAINKYSVKFTDAWCSEFVSWVYNESGIPFTGGSRNSPWILISSQEITNWFRSNNRYHSINSGYIPKRGDYVQSISADGTLHSSIVIGLEQDSETNKTVLVTIDGNWNNCVQIVKKEMDNNILGFGEISLE